jgi:dihydrofolate synthase / folylpolyglutamate synthase
MTYEQALNFLFEQFPAYHKIGKAAYKNDLKNTLVLDEYFGHPHMKFRTVHVAGTNGKGSVSHMIASVLQEAGYITGLYTSPHLKDFRERIKVNGEMISECEVVDFVTLHKEIIEDIRPSFFEMTMAMAFNYFANKAVDIAVIEVGLGGRLDSTNIITPVLSVITNIGHDHMDILGNTLAKVAAEKAGIIKKSIPVVIGESLPETKNIFISKAAETASEICFAEEEYVCSLGDMNFKKNERAFSLVNIENHKKIEGITVLGGDYQTVNLKTVICSLNILRKTFNISDENISEGIYKTIENTGLRGRWQILGFKPLIICDTGHNHEGLEYVLKQLSRIKKTRLHMVIGFVNDKDLKMILPLFPKDATYYFTKASIPRALDENLLKANAETYGLEGKAFTDVKTALSNARDIANPTDVIFVGGSTFVVAEAL